MQYKNSNKDASSVEFSHCAMLVTSYGVLIVATPHALSFFDSRLFSPVCLCLAVCVLVHTAVHGSGDAVAAWARPCGRLVVLGLADARDAHGPPPVPGGVALRHAAGHGHR